MKLINVNNPICREGDQNLTKLFSIWKFSEINALCKILKYAYLLGLFKIPYPNRLVFAWSYNIIIRLRNIKVGDEVHMSEQGCLKLCRLSLPYLNLTNKHDKWPFKSCVFLFFSSLMACMRMHYTNLKKYKILKT